MNILGYKSSGNVVAVLIKPFIIILFVVSFFFFYNSFLVDKSLESLKFSVSSVASADTVNSLSYLAPLIQFQLIDEMSSQKVDVEDLLSLQYTADIIGTARTGRNAADIASVMKDIITKKEARRGLILKFLDNINDFIKGLFRKFIKGEKKEYAPKGQDISPAILDEISGYENSSDFEKAIKLYRDTITAFPGYNQTPTLIVRLGYLLHKLGRFKEAEGSYDQVIRQFPGSLEANIAKGLIGKLQKMTVAKKETVDMVSKIGKAKSKEDEQKIYYELALSKLSNLSLEEAKASFKKAISIAPNTNMAGQCYLSLGICEKLLGNLDDSLKVFEEVSKIVTDPELRIQAKYQIAQIYRQKGDYEKSVILLNEILKDPHNKSIAPLLLFQQGSTLLFDIKDQDKAKEVFERLRLGFPVHSLVYPGTYFVDKQVKLDIPGRRPEELEKMYQDRSLDALVSKKVLDIIKSMAQALATRIADEARETVIKRLSKEQYISIELSQDKLNGYIKQWFPAGAKAGVWGISVRYDGNQNMTTFATIHTEGMPEIECLVSANFKMVNWVNQPYWQSGSKRRNWVIFTIKECRIGGMPVPPAFINPIVRPSIEYFNNYFPIDIEDFKLDRDSIRFAGRLKPDITKPQASTGLQSQQVGQEVLILDIKERKKN